MKASFFSFLAFSLALLLLVSSCTQPTAPSTTPIQSAPIPSETPVVVPSTSTGPLVEISLTAKDFSFEPAQIHVHTGDHVVIHAKSIAGHHGFGIQGYDINVDLPEGEEQLVEFNANRPGTFTFYCSVPCGSGHRMMKGQLIVD